MNPAHLHNVNGTDRFATVSESAVTGRMAHLTNNAGIDYEVEVALDGDELRASVRGRSDGGMFRIMGV